MVQLMQDKSGWECEMEIVRYNEKTEELSVRHNTRAVWKYRNVSVDMYNKILEAESPSKLMKDIFHNFNVGVYKEDL